MGAPSHGDGRTSERCHLDLGGEPRGDAITGKASVSRWGGLWGAALPYFPHTGSRTASRDPKSCPRSPRPRQHNVVGDAGGAAEGSPAEGETQRCEVGVGIRVPPGGRSCVRAKQGGMEFGFRYDSLSTQAEHGSGFSRPVSWVFC